jgi:hypothetical protein
VTPKVVIAVSVDGEYPSASIAIGTAHQIYSMPFTMVRVFSEDVVRARNRLAQAVLDTTDATHVLWWDTDEYVPDVQGTLDAMLASGHDVVGAAYVRKRKPRTIVGVPLGASLETLTVLGAFTEMRAIGFGFTLTSRHALEVVGDSARKYIDVLSSGERVRTADRFGLAYRHLGGKGDLCECAWGADVFNSPEPCEDVEMVSEDYSFCLRWREPYGAAGELRVPPGRVHLYTPKIPLQHFGMHAYE